MERRADAHVSPVRLARVTNDAGSLKQRSSANPQALKSEALDSGYCRRSSMSDAAVVRACCKLLVRELDPSPAMAFKRR